MTTTRERSSPFRRIVAGFRDPVLCANVLALAGGKIIGLTLVLTAMAIYLPPALHAQAPASGPSPEINAINTMWVLIAAFLVFCMQVGFVMLEAGFARSRESVNILVEGIVDTAICGVTFWAWGFAFMFEPGNGFIGTTGFFLNGLPDTYGSTGVPLLAFWVFQFAFADTCSTITSGAMVGRCGFVGDILYSIGVTGFIYPIIGHWAWGPDGFLATMGTDGNFLASLGMGFHDFAGSTGVSILAFFLFQYAFADTCSTITSGAMVGRTGFKGDLLYSIGVSGFIYPILGHWVWVRAAGSPRSATASSCVTSPAAPWCTRWAA